MLPMLGACVVLASNPEIIQCTETVCVCDEKGANCRRDPPKEPKADPKSAPETPGTDPGKEGRR